MIWPEFDADHLLVTSEQMACLEGSVLSSGMPTPSLMEKVGQGMVSEIKKQLPLLKNGIQVLVGPGHNGGDGLVVARELHLAGFNVDIWCPLPIKAELTAKHLEHCSWLGIRKLNRPPDANSEALWIDAVFGLGQIRPVPDFLGNLFRSRELQRPNRLISLDVPTGICSDSGQPLREGAAVAFLTLTVGLKKQGLLQDAALKHVGKLKRVEMGLPNSLLEGLPRSQPRLLLESDLDSAPYPEIDPVAMKYQRGRVLVIAGSEQYKGAAHIALKGVLASGVGSISGFFPEKMTSGLWQTVPEIVVKGSYGESSKDLFDFAKLLSDCDFSKFDAILIGPGLGKAEQCFSAWDRPLHGFQGLLVLDADAINQISDFTQGVKWLQTRQGHTWITPHHGEFQNLFPNIDASDHFKAAAKAAKLTGTGVLLKGAHSLVASPSGQIWQLEDTFSWAARCGFGDLLAGFAVGLGAIGAASAKKIDEELLALAMFLHAHAAKKSKKGSSAGCVSESLANIIRTLQTKDVALST
ncbi:NAD(P)H-hydrate dehydratase [Prochlorococcus sp. MIT 1341]|uniref:NAD(P)H-hydrate dehydratase n=1 Tax=Prochlorococcus sp. MIT 1341 TaxID=3096221 RepID=UPI002A764D91|nr:NAD(P)H-hydrate dehydratase [Prochlorococcus sp. MIT 1341]